MKKIFTFLILCFSLSVFAQDQLKNAKQSQPLFLVDGIIAGYDFIKEISPNNIQSMSVYKSGTPDNPLTDFEAHLKHGIIDIKMKKYQEQFTKVPLHTLNSMYQLEPNAPIYIDGFLVKNNKAEIFEKAIGEIQVTQNDSVRVLNILTSDKNPKRGIILPPGNSEKPKDKTRPVYIKQIK